MRRRRQELVCPPGSKTVDLTTTPLQEPICPGPAADWPRTGEMAADEPVNSTDPAKEDKKAEEMEDQSAKLA